MRRTDQLYMELASSLFSHYKHERLVTLKKLRATHRMWWNAAIGFGAISTLSITLRILTGQADVRNILLSLSWPAAVYLVLGILPIAIVHCRLKKKLALEPAEQTKKQLEILCERPLTPSDELLLAMVLSSISHGWTAEERIKGWLNSVKEACKSPRLSNWQPLLEMRKGLEDSLKHRRPVQSPTSPPFPPRPE